MLTHYAFCPHLCDPVLAVVARFHCIHQVHRCVLSCELVAFMSFIFCTEVLLLL
jgi:hypothetical protein